MDRFARFELRLLGGATLLNSDGAPFVGRAVHRHRLALLAYLATAHESGASRDKLIGLLWPERDASSARHLLRAAVHELRQALGSAAIEGVGDVLHLDERRVIVDVHQFQSTIAKGELEQAVALYRGPFLDGLFLDDAEEFESWASNQRTRIEQMYDSALESLASREGNAVRAIGWWRTLATRKPGDSRIVARAMEAFSAAGDRTAALGLADTHARFLESEYATKADASVVALTAKLRAEGEVMPVDDAKKPTVIAPAVAPRQVELAAPPVSTRAVRVRWMVMAGIVTLVATGAWSLMTRSNGDVDLDVLAVAPFTVVSGAPADLREGLPELLTQSLGQLEELRMVPARIVAQQSALENQNDAPAALARALRTDGVITGSVSQTPAGLVITASLVDGDGTTRARMEAHGSATALDSLVDQLTVGLLRELWGRRAGMAAPRLEAITTASPTALRAYLRGEAFVRKALWDSAASALATAVDLDSTFALAQLRLAEPYGWRYGMASDPARHALEAAQRFGHRLPHRERGLLAFRLLHESGDLRAIDSAEALVRRYPDDPEMQYIRADVRFHASIVLGRRFSAGAVAAFDTAARIDSASARVWAHAITLALRMGDSVRFDRAVANLSKLTTGSHVQVAEHPDYALLRRVRWHTPVGALQTLAERLRTNPPPVWQVEDLLRAVESACLSGSRPEPALVDSAYRAFVAAYPDAGLDRTTILTRRAWLAVSVGKLSVARPLIDRLWEVEPNEALRMAMVPVIAGYAPASWIAADVERLERATAFRDPKYSSVLPYLRAQLALAMGDAIRARASLRRVGETTRARRGILLATSGWARLVEGDTAGAITDMEAGLAQVGYDGDALNHVRPMQIVLLRVLARRSDRRDDAIDRIRGEQLINAYWPWWSRELASALRSAGEQGEAAREEQAFAAAWVSADSPPTQTPSVPRR